MIVLIVQIMASSESDCEPPHILHDDTCYDCNIGQYLDLTKPRPSCCTTSTCSDLCPGAMESDDSKRYCVCDIEHGFVPGQDGCRCSESQLINP